MTARRRYLANRRSHEVIEFDHGGRRYVAGLGRDATGRLAEIFLHLGKSGSDAEMHAQDCAVMTSLLLQAGFEPSAIGHSISGPISTLLRIVENER